MSSEPLISVIVCVYNGEKYIRECIDSIRMQTYKNLQIILVDDGATDSSGEILDSYSDDLRIQVIHQKNSGVSNARNNALSIAKGDYICIMDQDDILNLDYIEYFYRLCEDNHCEISCTPEVDKFFYHINMDQNTKDKNKARIISGYEAMTEMLYHKFVIAPWNKMIKRELIEKAHIRFNNRFFNGEGYAFSIECFQEASKVAVGVRKVYHYRVGDPQSGASVFKKDYINSSIQAQLYIKSCLKNITPELLKAWEFSNWHTHCDAFNIMVGCNVKKENQELYKALKKVCRAEALCALRAPVSLQQKLRGVLFKISPHFAACIINCFRVRKFAKAK